MQSFSVLMLVNASALKVFWNSSSTFCFMTTESGRDYGDSVDFVYDSDEEQSFVQWSNIRLGAAIMKHGWGIVNEEVDATTFELAYDALSRRGLNIYEMRAAFRLIRDQVTFCLISEIDKKLFF